MRFTSSDNSDASDRVDMLNDWWSRLQETGGMTDVNGIIYEISTREVQIDSPASLFHRILPANDTIAVKKSGVPEERACFHGIAVR